MQNNIVLQIQVQLHTEKDLVSHLKDHYGKSAKSDTTPAKAKADKPKAEGKVARSVKAVSASKVAENAGKIKDLKSAAAKGKADGGAITGGIDRIARGSSKAELFAAAKSAGIDHDGIKTKKDLVDHLKNHVYDHGKASATSPAKPGKASSVPDSDSGTLTVDNYRNYAKRAYGDVQGRLSGSERKAIEEYKGASFYAINSALRNDRGRGGKRFDLSNPVHAGSDRGKTVANLDSAIAKQSVPEDVYVFRGMKLKSTGRRKASLDRLIGKTIGNPGYLSTSTLRKQADLFSMAGSKGPSRDIPIRLKVSKGTPVLPVDRAGPEFNRENELLFGRGHRIRFTGKTVIGGKTYFDAELLPPRS